MLFFENTIGIRTFVKIETVDMCCLSEYFASLDTVYNSVILHLYEEVYMPTSFFQLNGIENITIYSSCNFEIDNRFTGLKNLKILEVECRKLTRIPNDLYSFYSLKRLHVNTLKKLPLCIKLRLMYLKRKGKKRGLFVNLAASM